MDKITINQLAETALAQLGRTDLSVDVDISGQESAAEPGTWQLYFADKKGSIHRVRVKLKPQDSLDDVKQNIITKLRQVTESSSASNLENVQGTTSSVTRLSSPSSVLNIISGVFVLAAVGAWYYVGYSILSKASFSSGSPTVFEDGWSLLAMRLYEYVPELILIAMGLVSGTIAFLLLRIVGLAGRRVIPAEDQDLVKEMLLANNQQGINNYILLSGLNGVVGTFTKVGLSGLPLATIVLTVFFAIMGLFFAKDSGMLDLAKLTLGAFIGSYVQRQSATDVQQQVIAARTQAEALQQGGTVNTTVNTP